MSDVNAPRGSGIPPVPEVPQVPDVPHVPEVPEVPPIPRDEFGGPPGGQPAAPPAADPPYAGPPSAGPAQAGQAGPPGPSSPPPGSGYPYPPTPGTQPATRQPLLSILSLVAGVVGLLGLPVAFVPFVGGVLTLLLPAAAIVLGALGRTREPHARGLWLTGLITGIVGVALALLSIVVWVIIFASMPSTYYYR